MREPNRSWPIRAVAVVSAILLVGCQTFQPATSSELERGDRIRVNLRETTDVELRQVTARDVTFVAGETVGVTGGQLTLSAFSVRRPDGGVVPAEGWTVRLDVEQIDGIQQQRMAVWRTVGLAAGIAAATFFGWESLGGGGEGGSNGGGSDIE